MIQIRRAADRGHADRGWLNARHSFSFAEYYDPAHMGFSALRVLNDDVIAPGTGFGMHGHHDMEIITYILQGELQHRDSMGNGTVIRRGDVQRMSAGSGVRHSEFNPSDREPVHLLQIWLLPSHQGGVPSYEQKAFSADEKRGQLRLIASPDGADGSVTIGQNVRVYAALLDGAEQASLTLGPGRVGFVQVASGSVSLNGQALAAGDGVRITAPMALLLDHGQQAEVLVFDLPDWDDA